MPSIWPWSITTSEPMSCCAITLTASRTVPLGGAVKRALPLMRRISLTSMTTSWWRHASAVSHGPSCPTRHRARPYAQVTPGLAPRARLLLIDQLREPQADLREDVEQSQGDQLDAHERHHPCE